MERSHSGENDIESRILDCISTSTAIDSLAAPGAEQYAEWPLRYHLCPERGNLLRHLDFSGLDVVEVGAGMGAVSRLLSEQAKTLTVIESSQRRYAALSSRLRDLKNWTGHVGAAESVTPTGKDVVVSTGLFEHAEQNQKPPADFRGTKQEWFLEQLKPWLGEDGVLILAIENALGLKYWAGAPEDHTQRLFESIAGFSTHASARTFALRELKDTLARSGLTHTETYYPFPDHKVPTCVLSEAFVTKYPHLVPGIATTRPYESYGARRAKFFPELLALEALGRAGLAGSLANSFLILASKSHDSRVMKQLCSATTRGKEIAWHYSNYRRRPTQTVFREERAGVLVDKTMIARPDAESESYRDNHTGAVWTRVTNEPARKETSLRMKLVRTGYFEGPDAALDCLVKFIRWSLDHWGTPLRPESLDAIATNVVILDNGRYAHFDMEWSSESTIPASWFILRNTLGLTSDFDIFVRDGKFSTLGEMYFALCRILRVTPDFEGDILREAQLQSLVTVFTSPEAQVKNLHAHLKRSWSPRAYPRVVHRYDEIFPRIIQKLPRGVYETLGKRFTQASKLPQSLLKRVFD